ncbi:NAD(P)H-dependent oxidoreductase [Pedobacter aquatilis]|uniref:NAD(P)H-dependent oxidoreductase n=1 Tax=Pedobacter aquatilis TaxID=351343 RepID=UPI0025B2F03E|nr:NAD(P)H-dependent oxidoreductase [Pedobacter aquatilis]MDN3587860.1 NAD(P)H-dependent oxidoreductase [Pedobacter aquatilis]
MKTLIIVTHPDLETSVINKRWVAELKKYPKRYTIHDLHQTYPDGNLDIIKEQQLIEAYETIVFQFPVYWFSCPALLKKWIDEVLIHGWAYGSKSGYKVMGKKIALAMSVGVEEYEYNSGEKYKFTLEELTRPFDLTFEYVKADYKPFFAYYGIDLNTTAAYMEKSVPLYLKFLDAL